MYYKLITWPPWLHYIIVQLSDRLANKKLQIFANPSGKTIKRRKSRFVSRLFHISQRPLLAFSVGGKFETCCLLLHDSNALQRQIWRDEQPRAVRRRLVGQMKC
jgi:hypothetical protein